MLAMRRAVEGLRLTPQLVLVDGNRLPVLTMPAQAIVKGDAKVPAISAASILAKVHRDRLCLRPARALSRSTASPPTRATRRPSTWRRCAPRRLRRAPAQLRAGARAWLGRTA